MEKEKKDQLLGFFKGLGTILLFFTFSFIAQIILYKPLTSSNALAYNLAQIGVYLFILLGMFLLYRKQLVNDLKNFKKEYISTAIRYWFIGLCIMIISNLIITNITGGIAANETEVRKSLTLNPISNILIMAIIAPLIEEITFRASFKKAFKNSLMFALVTSIFFGLAHIAKFNLMEILFIIPYGSLGFFFAKAYYDTNNIYTSYLAHFFHNLLCIFIILFLG